MNKVKNKITLPSGLSLSVTEWQGADPVAESKPVVFLIHGSGDAASVWNEVVVNLVAGYRVLGVDLRGHGDSDWATDGDYNRARMATDVWTLIEQMGLNKLILVGHSFGGEMALRLAAGHADVVERLVLVDYTPGGLDNNVNHIRGAIRAAHKPYASVADYAEVLHGRHPLAKASFLDWLAVETTCPSEDGGIRLKYDKTFLPELVSEKKTPLQQAETAILLRMLAGLRCPTLIMRGIGSSVLSQREAEKLVKEYLQRGTLAVIPAAGHSIQIDNPDAFDKSLRDFLRN